jgi:tRNA (cmo5U34)-methyltransferase
MTLNARSFEIQRWHSPDYVESWIDSREREETRSLLRKKLVSCLPFEPEAAVQVLDLGAGAGALSQEVLSAYPRARVVCQDFSEVMLTHARQNLAKFRHQVIFVQSDLSIAEWALGLTGVFDAVVSSLVMHTVPTHVREIYGEVFRLVKPGGCFLVADTSAPTGPALQNIYLMLRLKARQARIKTATGVEKSLAELEQELGDRKLKNDAGFPARVRDPLRDILTLANHLEWFGQAGFDEVDCLWKDLNHAVIGGFKHAR